MKMSVGIYASGFWDEPDLDEKNESILGRARLQTLICLNFEKVLNKNDDGLKSEQPCIYIYINLVRDHEGVVDLWNCYYGHLPFTTRYS